MRSVIPDANIFLRFILNDIPSQVKKTELLFNQAKKSEIEIKETIAEKSDEPFKIKFVIVPQKEKQTVTIIVE